MPTPQAEQPPTPLPGTTGLNEQMNNYLRTFSLWCRNGFRTKMDITAAAPGILLLSPGGSVYQLTVADDGTVTTAAVALGSGKP
jgi:hypothetical protein